MITTNKAILFQIQDQLLSVIKQTKLLRIESLDDVALKPNPFSDIGYLDLIESERREHKTGWKKCTMQYENLCHYAAILKKKYQTCNVKMLKLWRKSKCGCGKSGRKKASELDLSSSWLPACKKQHLIVCDCYTCVPYYSCIITLVTIWGAVLEELNLVVQWSPALSRA